ncbi:hypothetical protein Tsubulata_041089 [Turnera subulata]|uniref:Lipoyl-binding domain-containing protein n=1 Tax=Turnera subulata TaxID=218843 RepID=A0A9Q0FK82_9ROSI|nr:hypothetical protein Tsubulata_041089 [Turnera subulata]
MTAVLNFRYPELTNLDPSWILHRTIVGKMFSQGFTVGMKQFPAPFKRNAMVVSCVKSPEAAAAANKSDDAKTEIKLEKKNSKRPATFPNGFEALILEICDETEVAELKMKVGDFEMHLKRNLDAEASDTSGTYTSAETLDPVAAKTMEIKSPVPPPPAPEKSEKAAPFINHSFGKSSRLAALDASGAKGYVVVNSKNVGIFHRGRLAKQGRLPPNYEEGDLIREGKVLGYVNRPGGDEVAVKSDVDGEVLKLLVKDGEPVGYGDPIVAVLPSFHDIK